MVTWPSFIEYVRSKVNLLASEEHLKELMCQLQLVGEVSYVKRQLVAILSANVNEKTNVGKILPNEFVNESLKIYGCLSTWFDKSCGLRSKFVIYL